MSNKKKGMFAATAGVVALIGGVALAAGPTISSIGISPSQNGATITWMTDVPATGQIWYGTSTPYTASTTLGIQTSTSQSASLTGLMPGMTYHFAVFSTDTSGNTNSSTDRTFVTAAASSTAALSLGVASGVPGSMVTVNGSGFWNSEPVTVNFDGATSSLSANTNGDFSTTLFVPPNATSTNVPVTIVATGGSSGMSASASFTIMPPTGATTTTATSTSGSVGSIDLTALQNEIAQLQTMVTNLIAQVQNFLNSNGSNSSASSTGSTNGSYPPSNMSATIDQVGSIRAGTSVDFTGRNWAAREQVQVSLNGSVVTTAQADDGGNFSTGSLAVGNAVGSMTYTFTGLTSGITRTVTVNVTP